MESSSCPSEMQKQVQDQLEEIRRLQEENQRLRSMCSQFSGSQRESRISSPDSPELPTAKDPGNCCTASGSVEGPRDPALSFEGDGGHRESSSFLQEERERQIERNGVVVEMDGKPLPALAENYFTSNIEEERLPPTKEPDKLPESSGCLGVQTTLSPPKDAVGVSGAPSVSDALPETHSKVGGLPSESLTAEREPRSNEGVRVSFRGSVEVAGGDPDTGGGEEDGRAHEGWWQGEEEGPVSDERFLVRNLDTDQFFDLRELESFSSGFEGEGGDGGGKVLTLAEMLLQKEGRGGAGVCEMRLRMSLSTPRQSEHSDLHRESYTENGVMEGRGSARGGDGGTCSSPVDSSSLPSREKAREGAEKANLLSEEARHLEGPSVDAPDLSGTIWGERGGMGGRDREKPRRCRSGDSVGLGEGGHGEDGGAYLTETGGNQTVSARRNTNPSPSLSLSLPQSFARVSTGTGGTIPPIISSGGKGTSVVASLHLASSLSLNRSSSSALCASGGSQQQAGTGEGGGGAVLDEHVGGSLGSARPSSSSSQQQEGDAPGMAVAFEKRGGGGETAVGGGDGCPSSSLQQQQQVSLSPTSPSPCSSSRGRSGGFPARGSADGALPTFPARPLKVVDPSELSSAPAGGSAAGKGKRSSRAWESYWKEKRKLHERIWDAAEGGDEPMLSTLLDALPEADRQAAIHSKAIHQWTALHLAANAGHAPCVRLLCERGAAVDAVTELGRSALHLASEQGHEGVVAVLLEFGAEINLLDSVGASALHEAGSKGHRGVVKLLLDRGADPFIRNNLGMCAADLPLDFKTREIIRGVMRDHAEKQKGNEKDGGEEKYSRTPFHSVLLHNARTDVVKKLLFSTMQRPHHAAAQQQQAGSASARSSTMLLAGGAAGQHPDAGPHDADALAAAVAGDGEGEASPPYSLPRGVRRSAASIGSAGGSLREGQCGFGLWSRRRETVTSSGGAQAQSDRERERELEPEEDFEGRRARVRRKRATHLRSGSAAAHAGENRSRRSSRGEQERAGSSAAAAVGLSGVGVRKPLVRMRQREEGDRSSSAESVGPSSFLVRALLGKGSFGEVYKVELKTTGEVFAMKILRKDRIVGRNLVRYAMTERNVLSYVKHPFIVRLHWAFQTPEFLVLVLQFCPGGNLQQLIARCKRLKESIARVYLAEVLLALEHLHERNVVYRDLKPDNIVIDSKGHALLTDFGLSKEGVEREDASSFCGSVAYLAPEMLKRKGHGAAVDLYGLGVLLYEMLTGIPPFYHSEREVLFRNIEGGTLKIPSHVSREAASLVRMLMDRDPTRRIGFQNPREIRSHAFFAGVDWHELLKKQFEPLPLHLNPVVAGRL
eukprot:Cvel_9124.t1-p1 / transcript=Cvel_9124.t1 / gene=Cvel_9124 / organism=Chromera_velia_CCMP2878 / gene_product=Protein kinase 2, putative / transcript_product=Protein kinase 2, putative / location=Cvel_scaffold518:75843-83843(+) / protein_length=1345 / sequence_SO=supercontig / SO=protein_coding / is_pseudo=false